MSLYRRVLAWLTRRRGNPLPPHVEPADWMLPASLEERRREIEGDLRRLNREADVLLQRLKKTH